MGKVKKFKALGIKKISGGKDPVNLVEEFILRRGFDPEECKRESSTDFVRWMLEIGDGEELEVLLESLKKPSSTTIYMGINILTVPLRGSYDILVSALKIADGLVGIKVSLVGHELVLSSSMAMADIALDDIDFYYRLITAQQTWFREELLTELGWDFLPEE
jgi:hypothetical protein